MTPFFASAERRSALTVSAFKWIGTPFVPHARVRGSGVDCIQFCAAIYIEAGVLAEFSPPHYDIDGGRHAPGALVEPYVEASGRFDCVWSAKQSERVESLQVGDLACFTVGRISYHCGVAVNHNEFVHALHPNGVVLSGLYDPTWSKRVRRIYRPIEGI